MACIFKPGDKVIYKRLYGMNREYLKEGKVYTVLTIATNNKIITLNNGYAVWEDELELCKPLDNGVIPHKGCKFDNNDFYRAFTNKSGQITFNQVKVSTVCICTVEDDIGEKNIFFATYNGKRIKQGTKVKFVNGRIGEVNCSFKIMDKYLKELVMTLSLFTTNIVYPIQEIIEILQIVEIIDFTKGEIR